MDGVGVGVLWCSVAFLHHSIDTSPMTTGPCTGYMA
jgi:hypothetical protein